VVSIRGASDAGISDHAGDLAIGTATATTTSGIGAHSDSLLAGCLVHVVAPSWARRAAGKAAALSFQFNDFTLIAACTSDVSTLRDRRQRSCLVGRSDDPAHALAG
jgi:hypothetical protein